MPTAQTSRTPEKKIQQTKNSLQAATKTPFMYPLDVTSSFIYMHIVPHKISAGEILTGVSLTYEPTGGENAEGAATTGDAESTIGGLGGGNRAIPVAENKVITETSIILPIPEKLADKLSISYNASSLGVSAAMFTAGQSLATGGEAGADVRSASAYAARQMLSTFSQELGDIFALTSSSVPNPYSTLMFKQVEQRSFDFSYTFAPTSEKETEAIKKIINALRYLSLPAEDNFFLDFPYEFEISFAGSNYLYAFSRGYITDIAVEYGGDGGVTFFDTTAGRGAAPTIVKLAFTFKEIYPLSRTVIDYGAAESMKVDSIFFEDDRKREAERENPGATEEAEQRQQQGTEQANREEARKYTGLDCVCIDSIVFDGRTASKVEVGDELDTIDPTTKEFKKQIVTRSETKLSECVRITTESGIQLDCSTSAPISDEHGNQVLAPNLCGIMIPVIDNEEHRLERVVSVEEIGIKEVRHITVNDSFFPAGKEANRYILHHNKQ